MPDSNVTKKALAGAMKELMAKAPFSKISVGGICERCGMNRKSFYYHFKDKYDLVNWIFYTEFIQSVHAAQYATGWDFLSDMCRYFYRERDFYRCAMQIQGQNSFREYFCEVMAPFLSAFTKDLFSDAEDAHDCVNFFGDAFLVSLVHWLTDGVGIPPEEYLARLRRIVVRLAWHIVEEDAKAP